MPSSNFVNFFDPDKAHHRAWLQAVLDRLLSLDPEALSAGSELQTLWKAAVETKPPTSKAVSTGVQRLLQEIYRGEGGYDSYNQGRAGDSPGGYPGGLQSLTIAQVMALQASGRAFAVGSAQFIPETLAWAVKASGIAAGSLFNAEAQDRLAQAILLKGKRPALRDYLTGKTNDLSAAQLDLAREWASIPGPDGRGVYDGDRAGNRAHGDVKRVQAALKEARASLAGGNPVDGKAATGMAASPGMVGPTKRPQEFGFKAGDSHLIVNDVTERVKAFDHSGKLLWELPCLARGQGADNQWHRTAFDTPPGLYKVGAVYNDYGTYGSQAPRTRETIAYGWLSFDLIELENQEARYGRAGIMLHGGGSACGWPGAWEPMQALHPTLGCVRMHNQHLRDFVHPLTKKGKVFISVWQEA